MKIIFFSDTHWTLKQYFADIDFADIDLIVFCWDNTIKDFELFSNIKIKKIWILWNNLPHLANKKINIFKEFNIEDITWRKYIFKNISFYWIDGKMLYLIQEKIWGKIEKLNEFLNTKVDIVISHFPVFWIMDDPEDFSHLWLKFLREYIQKNDPQFLIHWHMHVDDKSKFLNTKIIQIYPYKIIQI